MRVTIGELVEDFIPHTENGNKITQVEIVPRKIVELIIYYCESNADLTSSYNTAHYDNGWKDALNRVKERAEFLLKEFENGGADMRETKGEKWDCEFEDIKEIREVTNE